MGKMPLAAQNVGVNGAKGVTIEEWEVTMCSNLKPIPDESAIVYKVVARKLTFRTAPVHVHLMQREVGRYYSIAMGFKYPKLAGKVPKVRVQHRLAFFISTILNKKCPAYSHQMAGRTAGFIYRADAECLANKIRRHYPTNVYKMIVVKAKLTDELMSGTYNGSPVVAGKHIKWLE